MIRFFFANQPRKPKTCKRSGLKIHVHGKEKDLLGVKSVFNESIMVMHYRWHDGTFFK